MPLLSSTLKSEILKITSPVSPATFPATSSETAQRWAAAVGTYFAQAVTPPGAVAISVIAQAAFSAAMAPALVAAPSTAIDAGLLAFVASFAAVPAIVPPPTPPVVAIWMNSEILASVAGTVVTADAAASTLSGAMDLWFKTGTVAGGTLWG